MVTVMVTKAICGMLQAKEIRIRRNDWNLTVAPPVGGNYYPVNLGIFIEDGQTEFSASIHDGQLEFMLHREQGYNSKVLGEDAELCNVLTKFVQSNLVKEAYFQVPPNLASP
ncbi:hypothetical protein Leryth_022390 [Lithospermum erythrorhizon]|nr:hypothetical protein Leryth_022390 [Lithospermum erythrorhizon]